MILSRLAAGRTCRRLDERLRIVDVGLLVEACNTTGEDGTSGSISRESTSQIFPAEAGTDVETKPPTIPGVRTSSLYVQYILPEVCVEGVAEGSRGGGNTGPVDAVDTEAVGGPVIFDGNSRVAADVEDAPVVVAFFLWTVVHGSRSSDHGSCSSALLLKYFAPVIEGAETRLVGQRVSTRLSSSVRWEATSADPC